MDSTNINPDWQSADPTIWKPEQAGETLQGFLTLKRPKTGDRSAYYQLQDNDNNIHIVWGSAVLDSRMRAIPIGNEVRITFKGTQKSSKGKNPMKLFDVQHRKNPNSTLELSEENVEE